MRLGLSIDGGGTIETAAELGITGVPINAADLVEQGVDATLAPLREKGLSVCQIGAFGVNPLSDDAEGQAAQQDMLRAAIPLAAETGCPYIVINGGNHHPSGFGHWDARNWSDAAFDRIVEVLDPLVSLAADHGAKISIEPYLTPTINSPETFARVRDRLSKPDAMVANIDVTSLYDFRDYIAPAERCRAVCEGFAGAYGLGHIKDIVVNEGFHLNMGMAPLGTSPTDWAEVLRMMAPHLPDDSWLILEHQADPDAARLGVEKLRGYAREAGVTLT